MFSHAHAELAREKGPRVANAPSTETLAGETGFAMKTVPERSYEDTCSLTSSPNSSGRRVRNV